MYPSYLSVLLHLTASQKLNARRRDAGRKRKVLKSDSVCSKSQSSTSGESKHTAKWAPCEGDPSRSGNERRLFRRRLEIDQRPSFSHLHHVTPFQSRADRIPRKTFANKCARRHLPHSIDHSRPNPRSVDAARCSIMASPAALPTELVVFVLENFDSLNDLASLARLDRRFYSIVNPLLYKQAVEKGSTWPLVWAAHRGVRGTLVKALEAGIDPNFTFFDNQSREAWNKASAPPKPYVNQNDDLEAWNSDHGSESDHNIDWSPDTTDSDRAGSTNQPSSDSSRSGMYMDSYEHSRSEYRSEFKSEYSDDEMMDSYDYPDEVSVVTNSEVQGMGLPEITGTDEAREINRRFTALHLAARGGHTDVIRILLDHGADINAGSDHFCDCRRMYGLLNSAECPELEPTPPTWSPLHTALCNAHSDAAVLLLSRGASTMMDVSTELATKSNATALHHAAAHGLVDVVRHLSTEGIQPHVDPLDEKTLTPLYYAYANRRWDSTVPALVQLGANINVDTKMFLPYCTITPLGESLRLGNWEDADRLLDLGADARRGFIATPDGGGLSPPPVLHADGRAGRTGHRAEDFRRRG